MARRPSDDTAQNSFRLIIPKTVSFVQKVCGPYSVIQAALKRPFEACFWSENRHNARVRCAETNVGLQVSLHVGLHMYIFM